MVNVAQFVRGAHLGAATHRGYSGLSGLIIPLSSCVGSVRTGDRGHDSCSRRDQASVRDAIGRTRARAAKEQSRHAAQNRSLKAP